MMVKKMIMCMNPNGFCLKYMVCSVVVTYLPSLGGNQEQKEYLAMFWES